MRSLRINYLCLKNKHTVLLCLLLSLPLASRGKSSLHKIMIHADIITSVLLIYLVNTRRSYPSNEG